ncbi:hypothetical protein J1N35_014234 [Gossypium stocksii]|uniref:Uncharacterized protein n=1 Tax=Gossypium stocksii TaxID=47602 RepID=A0A9D3VV19_9ROSI|nr:hypothetical protein J1N35_014234 [Gossypium stocksii]
MEHISRYRNGFDHHASNTNCLLTISFGLSIGDPARPYWTDAYETYSERIVREARGIGSQELKRAHGINLHTSKEFTRRGLQTPTFNLERYTCPTCLRPAQSVSLMNNEVKL